MSKWLTAFACLFSYKISALSPKAQLRAFLIEVHKQNLTDDFSDRELEGAKDLTKSFFEVSLHKNFSDEMRLTAALAMGWREIRSQEFITQLFTAALNEDEPVQLREIWMDHAAIAALQSQEGLKNLLSLLKSTDDEQLIFDYFALLYRAQQISKIAVAPNLRDYLSSRDPRELISEKAVLHRLVSFDQTATLIIKKMYEEEKNEALRDRLILFFSALQYKKPKKILTSIELNDSSPQVRRQAYISLVQMSGWRDQGNPHWNSISNTVKIFKVRAELLCAELLNSQWAPEDD